MTSRSAAGNGNGRSSTPLTTLKMAVFAPMPIASVSTATAVKPGFFSSWRKAYFKSFIRAIYGSELRSGQNTKTHEQNIKPQAPNTRKSPTLKLKGPEVSGGIGIWTLGFLWCLDLGVWCFHTGVWSLVSGAFIRVAGSIHHLEICRQSLVPRLNLVPLVRHSSRYG